MKRILFLGAPGAGKGTQAQKIAHLFSIPQISTGDLLRAEIKSGSEFGKEISEIIQAGQLVNDQVVARLVSQRIAEPDCQEGYILDGFPRNLAQAKICEESNIGIDAVIDLVVPNDVILERITGRRVHPASGRVYHVKFNAPKVEGKDDVTGEDLVIRQDDTAEVVTKRLAVYEEQTKPLTDYYKDKARQGKVVYLRINGNNDPKDVEKSLRDELRTVFN